MRFDMKNETWTAPALNLLHQVGRIIYFHVTQTIKPTLGILVLVPWRKIDTQLNMLGLINREKRREPASFLWLNNPKRLPTSCEQSAMLFWTNVHKPQHHTHAYNSSKMKTTYSNMRLYCRLATVAYMWLLVLYRSIKNKTYKIKL